GVCKKLAHACSRRNARCSSAEIGRTVLVTATRLPGGSGAYQGGETLLLRGVAPANPSANTYSARPRTGLHSKATTPPDPPAPTPPPPRTHGIVGGGSLRHAPARTCSQPRRTGRHTEEASDDRPAHRRRAPPARRTSCQRRARPGAARHGRAHGRRDPRRRRP